MSPAILFIVSSGRRHFGCYSAADIKAQNMGYGFDVEILIAVRKKIIGLLASEAFAFPRSTLKNNVKKQDDYMEGLADIPLETEVMLPLKLKINYLSAV